MEAMINLLAKYFGIDPAILFAAVANVESTAPSSTSVYVGDNDGEYDESDDYASGIYVDDNDHDESNEYVNVVYGGSAVVRSSAGYSEISDDRNDQYRFELKGSELADGDLVDAGEQIVAKY